MEISQREAWAGVQAASMGTGGFVSPPPGEVFSGAGDHPAVGSHGPPGAVREQDIGTAAGARLHALCCPSLSLACCMNACCFL
jgi:hypothetical protein